MYSDWTKQALADIALTVSKLPEDAPLAERKRALRANAWRFHQGTSWGKRVWGRECRKHLELHGQAPRKPVEASPLFADDITFPFRSPA